MGGLLMMIATESQFQELFGSIGNDVSVMARCACVTCNSCTCACSCRRSPDNDETGWVE
ncbi:FibroRumin family radical SAM-modified Cys-rich RiPP [Desulfovibrio litoralis]|uniref:FibroRumin family radical SAM-modified Cys-rich RiPP n=1 Tax=Desulfovibrio litoralis TaxID=466107 RepID=UPI003CCB9A7D